MKRSVSVLLIFVFAVVEPALAIVEGRSVLYIGGTVSGVTAGTTGAFDTTSADRLIFESAGVKVQIPYAEIRRFNVSEELARHMGVIATIAVVMLKYRRRRHFVEIEYRDANGDNQAAIFEVSKDMSKTIEVVLRARAPRRDPQAQSLAVPSVAQRE